MPFPTGTQITTDNVSSPSSDPSLARVDIYNLIEAVNAIIASYNSSQGVLVLDGSALVPEARIPTTVPVNTLQPASKVVQLSNVLRLSSLYAVDLGSTGSGTESPINGDVCYLMDGDAGQPCLGVYDGFNWRVVRLATQVGDVGAELTATATLAAEAD